ncbi:MAG: hypothetical protein QOE00_2486 [Ilumatobacteraceae bacterium]
MKRLLIGIAALAALSACGAAPAADRQVASLSTAAANDTTPGTGDVTGTTSPKDPQEAALQFAKCMREHGIDMPDPVVKTAEGGETQVAINMGGQGPAQKPNQKDMEAANKDCQHFMADGGGTFNQPSAEDQAKMQEQALAFAKCMRDHGVDMPDPQFSGDGNFSIGFTTADGSSNSGGPPIDPNSTEFKDANEACGGQNGGGFSISSGTVPG